MQPSVTVLRRSGPARRPTHPDLDFIFFPPSVFYRLSLNAAFVAFWKKVCVTDSFEVSPPLTLASLESVCTRQPPPTFTPATPTDVDLMHSHTRCLFAHAHVHCSTLRSVLVSGWHWPFCLASVLSRLSLLSFSGFGIGGSQLESCRKEN